MLFHVEFSVTPRPFNVSFRRRHGTRIYQITLLNVRRSPRQNGLKEVDDIKSCLSQISSFRRILGIDFTFFLIYWYIVIF